MTKPVVTASPSALLPRTLAVITGAAGDIGQALAHQCADAGHDLVLCADRGPLDEVAFALREAGATVDAVHCDVSCQDGLQKLTAAIGGRPVDALLISAGPPLMAPGFLDQPFDAVRHAVDTQVTSLLALLHQVGRGMRQRCRGRILIAGALGAERGCPGLDEGLRAFFDSFTCTLREELKGAGVSVTVLLPGPGDAQFLGRGSLVDAALGAPGPGAGPDPVDLARIGFRAMCEGQGDVVAGFRSRLQAMLSGTHPSPALEATPGATPRDPQPAPNVRGTTESVR